MLKLGVKVGQLTHGLAESVTQLVGESPEFRDEGAVFIEYLVILYVFVDGKLVVANAGM